jgi:single-strand DNA-binding protein
MSVNTIYLSGRAGKDPEIRTTQSGSKVASFSLCTGGKYTTKDGREVDDTAWHSIVAWKNLADTTERFIKKGSQVLVIGHLTYREWTDNNGTKRTTAEIIADKIEPCIVGQGQQPPAPAPAHQQRRPATTPIPTTDNAPDDDLPF